MAKMILWQCALLIFVGTAAVGNASKHAGRRNRALSSSQTYWTDEDIEARDKAQDLVKETCEDVSFDVDEEAARAKLKSATGGHDILRDAMVESDEPEEVLDKVKDKVKVEFAIRIAGALVVAILLGVLWCCCCWTFCCARCRCCKRAKRYSILVRSLPAVAIVLLLIATWTGGALASAGSSSAADGLDSVICSSATVLSNSLAGEPKHHFMGMIPLLEEFGDLRAHLDDDSTFLTNVFAILDQTKDIEKAVYLAEQSVALLKDMLGLDANLKPQVLQSGTAEPGYHKCVLCQELQGPLNDLVNTLASSAAEAMSATHQEVEDQLDSSNRADLRSTLDNAIDPLRDAATTVRDSTKFFFEGDWIDLKDKIIDYSKLVIAGVFIPTLLVGGAALLAAACCIGCQEKKRTAMRRSASCSWCFGWWFAVAYFLISGLLTVLALPGASLCLVLDDLSSELLEDILPAAGSSMDMSSDGGEMVVNIIDKCLSKQAQNSNESLVDILYVSDGGTKVTIREKIHGATAGELEARFDELRERLDSTNVQLMQEPAMQELLSLIQDNTIDQAIIVDTDETLPFQDIANDPRSTDGLGIGLYSSLSCTGNLTILDVQAKLEGFTSSALQDTSPAASCDGGTAIKKVACDDNSICTNEGVDTSVCQSACTAGNLLMDYKAALLTDRTFRCDVFVSSSNVECDVKDMTKDGSGQYVSDCLETDGSGNFQIMGRKEKECTLPEFVDYITQWHGRLSAVFTRIDETADSVKNKIVDDMWAELDDAILQPVEYMLNETHCTFMGEQFSDIVTGLCFKGVVGVRSFAISLTWIGCCTIGIVLCAYIIWRYAVDRTPQEVAPADLTDMNAEVNKE